jgi:hypothetical protein
MAHAAITFLILIGLGWLIGRAFDRFCEQMEDDLDGY